MKTLKKTLALLLCAMSAASGFSACSGREGAPDVDETKTQLHVKYYNGGLGDVWINQVIADFEKKYENHSFQDGKMGVQIQKDFEKSNIQADLVSKSPNHVFLLESMNYYEFYSKGVMYDLTDLVQGYAATGPNETESARTIESKMNADRKNFYNMGTEAKADYKALPFYESSMSLIYNVDLFEKKGWYLAEGKTAEGMTEAEQKDFAAVYPLFIPYDDTTTKKSNGPDGKTGVIDGVDYSADDGLPATYADFQALLTVIKTSGATPFIGNGYSTDYFTSLATEIWATASGLDEIKLSMSLNGTSNTILDLDKNGKVQYDEQGNLKMLENVEITPSNAYLLHAQKGKLDAIKFVKMLMEAGYYSSSFSPSFSHRMAQEYFINGYEKELVGSEIAMLVDGSWWNSEARKDYVTAEERATKRFANMPIPKPDASQIGENTVRVSERSSLMFVNAYTPKKILPAALEFMSYLQSDEAMNTFSVHTDMLRGMDYTITEDNLALMTNFGRANYQMSRAKTTDWIEWVPTSLIAKQNSAMLGSNKWGFSDGKKTNPFIYYKDNGTTAPATYFTSIYNHYKNGWNLK